MKLMLPVALAALGALTGCVGYGGGVYGASGTYYDTPYGAASPYYGTAPYYGYGSGAVVIEQRYGSTYPYAHYPNSTYGTRRDRDGDGVPNWRDRAPDNPRRY